MSCIRTAAVAILVAIFSIPAFAQVQCNWSTGDSTKTTLPYGCFAGVGVTNPSAFLDLKASTGSTTFGAVDTMRLQGNNTSSWVMLHLTDATYTDGFIGLHPDTSSAANRYLAFGVNSGTTPQMVFTGQGRLGLGLTAPNSMLEVYKSAGFTTRLGGDDSAADKAYGVAQVIANSSFTNPVNVIYTNHTAGNSRNNELFRIHSNEEGASGTAFRVTTGGTVASPTTTALAIKSLNGAVGIGHLPANGQLDLKGQFWLENASTGHALRFLAGTTGGTHLIDANYGTSEGFLPLRINANAAAPNQLYLNTTGNVGIGTSATSERLTVAGNVKADAYLLSDGSSLVTSAGTFGGGTFTFPGNLGIGASSGGTSHPLYIRDSSTTGAVVVPANQGIGMVYERTATSSGAAIALVGGSKTTGGVGRVYLGNSDEWNSTYIDGGNRKFAFYVKGASGDIAAMTINANGDLKVQGNIEAKYQDVAEWVPSNGKLAAGTVVIINPEEKNVVMPSKHAYDTSVAGVVSDMPGVLLGEASDMKSKIATTGRVRVHVDATKRPINAGDLLVTSEKPGVAMASEPIDLAGTKIHRPGTLIGKALEPLQSGDGEILVLLSLQ